MSSTVANLITVLDPRTGDVVTRMPVTDPHAFDDAVARAANAAPGGASEPRRASGSGFGFGPELLDEMTAVKVVHWSPPGQST